MSFWCCVRLSFLEAWICYSWVWSYLSEQGRNLNSSSISRRAPVLLYSLLSALVYSRLLSHSFSSATAQILKGHKKLVDGQWGWQNTWLKDSVRGFPRHWISLECWYPMQPTQLILWGAWVRGSVWDEGWALYSKWKKLAQNWKHNSNFNLIVFFKGQMPSFDFLQSSRQEILSLLLLLSSLFLPASLSLFRALCLFSGQEKNKVTGITQNRICKFSNEKQCLKVNLHAKNMRKAALGACDMMRVHGGSITQSWSYTLPSASDTAAVSKRWA